MKKKICILILFSILSFVLIGLIVFAETKSVKVLGSVSGIFASFVVEKLFRSIQDLSDTTFWKTSQRKLKRAGIITDNSIIRISFAYLFRIQANGKYLLVKSERKTGKFQPIGGVYKFLGNEKNELTERYKIIDDSKVPIDQSSRDDYRLQITNRHLRAFVKRFDKKANRERLDNISREFREELINKKIVNWNQITYRVCGRHITDLFYSDHFQIYELLLADVVELIPTDEQKTDLIRLMENNSEYYRFATAEEIKTLGVNTISGDMFESIADHSIKILQETEELLTIIPEVGKYFTVSIQ